MKRFLLVCLFLIAASSAAFTQATVPAPTPTPDDDRDVVKITTNLIQIDVTVVDSRGHLVTDLKPEEIEIYENDEKQKITNFSFINTETKLPAKNADKNVDKNAAPIPEIPRLLKPDQVKRMIALVVDDLSLSFESTAHVRQALKKFVDEQMQPEDMVAIIRTGSGIGALQQFTSNKRQLYAAIEQVKWDPSGKADISAIAPIEVGLPDFIRPPSLIGKQPDEDTKELEQYRQEVYSVGTLGSINYIVKGMRGLPGRKSVVLFSDGLKLEADDFGLNPRIMTGLRTLTDLANRAAVVIYTMDARGLQPLSLTAADSIGGLKEENVQAEFAKLNKQKGEFFDSQSGLNFLAKATGGISIKNENDMSAGLEKILDDQKSYYLVGYQPSGETFDPVKRRFNDLDVKVTRPGLKVRFRSGFFGITNENIKPTSRTAQEQVVDALASPFTTGEITIRLTPIVTNDLKDGSYINSLVHIQASDLKFTDEPDGWKKITFDIVAVALGDSGTLVDKLSRSETIKVKDETYEKMLRDGFVYAVPFPIKKPGGYQLRIALRDAETARIGSANQFIEVPDLKKNRLVISDIILQNVEAQKGQNDAVAPDDSTSDYLLNTALRRFKSGSALFYNTVIFNPKLESTTGRPNLKTQVKIYRDGQTVYASDEADYVLDAFSTPKRLPLRGAMRLGAALPPGQYILQIVVRDMSAKEKSQLKTKWIDFEIVN
jgi:VWFA-related protein